MPATFPIPVEAKVANSRQNTDYRNSLRSAGISLKRLKYEIRDGNINGYSVPEGPFDSYKKAERFRDMVRESDKGKSTQRNPEFVHVYAVLKGPESIDGVPLNLLRREIKEGRVDRYLDDLSESAFPIGNLFFEVVDEDRHMMLYRGPYNRFAEAAQQKTQALEEDHEKRTIKLYATLELG